MSNADEFYTRASAATSAPVKKFLKDYGPAMAFPAVAGAIQYFFSKKNIAQEIEALKNSYGKALNLSDKMSDDKERAAIVFQELCAVAPTVAMNPSMAVKVIEPRLKKGLTVDDVHKLTMINAYAKPSIFSKTPMGEAKRTAGFAADRLFTTLGLKAFEEGRGAVNKSKAAYTAFSQKEQELRDGKYDKDDLQKFYKRFEMKKESSQQISEKCSIEMMADRYVLLKQSSLYKEASILNSAKGIIEKAAPYMLATLAVAGVAHGFGAAVDALQKKKLEAQAHEAFEKLKKSSDIISGNQAMANDAFDAIKTFAPSLAAKPAILKTFIEHSISVDGRMPPEMINQLATAQGNIGRSKPMGFASGFIDTASTVGKNLDPKKEDKGGHLANLK